MCGTDSCVILAVPNIKLRMEAQNSFQLLRPHVLFRKNFICSRLLRVAALLSSLHKHDSTSVQLDAAKFEEVVVVYVTFFWCGFCTIIFTE